MNEKRIDQKSLKGLLNVNKIIHEPARLLIMAYLTHFKEADYIFLIRQTGLTPGNFSSHVRKLEDTGYILIKKEFIERKPHSTIQITKEGQSAFKSHVLKMKGFYNSF
jgi:DNA-binding MarR family transcriptional regulator